MLRSGARESLARQQAEKLSETAQSLPPFRPSPLWVRCLTFGLIETLAVRAPDPKPGEFGDCTLAIHSTTTH